MTELFLDLKGLKCPLPALRTRKALSGLAPGVRLRVACTDPMAMIDIPHALAMAGHVLLARDTVDGVLHFTIERGANQPQSEGDDETDEVFPLARPRTASE